MKRKTKYNAWFWSEYTKGKVPAEILQAVGHLSFLWNDVEEALDRAVVWAVETPAHMQVEVRSRIQGLDGKIEIVKAAINQTEHLPESKKKDLLATLGAFQALKECRDAVIHAKASEIHKGIARTFERRGAVYEVLLTIDALNDVNSHLEIYNKEMACLAGVMGGITPTGRAFRRVAVKDLEGPNAELMRTISQADTRYFDGLKDCQAKRKKLRPLPKAPS